MNIPSVCTSQVRFLHRVQVFFHHALTVAIQIIYAGAGAEFRTKNGWLI
jgi:hypothetical protein